MAYENIFIPEDLPKLAIDLIGSILNILADNSYLIAGLIIISFIAYLGRAYILSLIKTLFEFYRIE